MQSLTYFKKFNHLNKKEKKNDTQNVVINSTMKQAKAQNPTNNINNK